MTNKNHKSGQAALILVIITMVTVLGVAVTSASQSTINLRDATYSMQGDQALACAEAGVEVGLAKVSDSDFDPANDTLDYEGKNPCSYEVEISNYPGDDGIINIARLEENVTQQFDVEGLDSDLELYFKPLQFNEHSSLAVYLYEEDEMTRSMYYCSFSGVSAPSDDFVQGSVSGDECKIDIDGAEIAQAKYLRVRPLYADMQIRVQGFDNSKQQTGWRIVSKGIAGAVRRTITVTKFYSQMPSAFDEAIVSFAE